MVLPGQPVAVMEALKMEHVIASSAPAASGSRAFPESATRCSRARRSCSSSRARRTATPWQGGRAPDPEAIRPDLARIHHLHYLATDRARRAATAKRHAQGRRTIRETIDRALRSRNVHRVRPDVTAARHALEILGHRGRAVLRTAADGMVIGVGQVNGELVGPENARCAVVAYDYSVLAGTQGVQEPSEDRPHAPDCPAVQAACRAVFRGRRWPRGRRLGPAGPRGRRPRHRRLRRGPGSSSANFRGWSRSSASSIRATASPATWSCWAPAT